MAQPMTASGAQTKVASQRQPDQPRTSAAEPERPVRAPRVELVGEMQGTGFRDQQWLVQRDGRFLQVSELLYRILERADGERTLEEVAARVTESTNWLVSADQVRHLVRTRLLPLGLVAAADGVAVAPGSGRAGSPLSVNFRMRFLPPRVIDPITRVLQWLYLPPVLVPVLIAVVIGHWWLYFVRGLADSVHAVLFTPGALLIVLALMPVAALVHEFGHAAALRYGGARARGIGAGLYLVYPVFFTDATDSYRLGRWGRVRTDLGGLYFNLIFAIAVMAIAVASGHEFLLIVVPLITLEIIGQCLPFVRFDGYWALADLTGIPDFFSQMVPFLRRLLGLPAAGRGLLPTLRPWVKTVFVGYIVMTIPVLVLLAAFMVKSVPYLVTMSWEAAFHQVGMFSTAWGAGNFLIAVAAGTQILLLALEGLAVVYVLYRLSWPVLRGIWRLSTPTPTRRLAGALVTGGIFTALAYVWAPQLPLASLAGFARVTASAVSASLQGQAAPAALQSETAPSGVQSGVQSYTVTEADHVLTPVAYAQTPPVGGNHAPVWQNCGFYAAPVANEHAVHSMEHGAVWITYRPDLPREQVDALRRLAQGQTYVLVSPYRDLPAPVVASAWGRQLRLQTTEDPALAQFVGLFRQGRQAPERGGPCTGGTGAPA